MNTGGYNGCTADCKHGPFCGDKIVQSDHEACDDGLICTESVIVCINVPLDVHCSAMAREKTSIDVVIELVESRPRSWVMPVISTDCDRCIRSVSPMWGRICSRTAWE